MNLAVSTPQSRPIRLAGSILGDFCHVAAFFSNRNEEYRTVLPFIKDGLDSGEKVVNTIDPMRRDDHLERMASFGIDVTTVCERGQLELRDWNNTYLINGEFDRDRTYALYERLTTDYRRQGFSRIRFLTHMEWALEAKRDIDDLLEYEAKSNEHWLGQEGRVDPSICTYDLSRFGGDVVVDVIRTHPLVIIGGVLQENPFFVSAAEFLRELKERGLIRKR
jgi:hypothetical protein